MNEFLFRGFILSLVFNSLWILAIFCGSNLKLITKCVVSIILIVVCTYGFAGMIYISNKEWNNGYCVRCGTGYQAIGYSKGDTRYECPSCHYGLWK